MKIEDQVVSLELSKKLKELGVKQESYFVWATDNPRLQYIAVPSHMAKKGWDIWCSAFSVAELGEMVPLTADLEHRARLTCKKGMTEWVVGYAKYLEDFQIDFGADTEANARAQMLIYLIEQGLVKP